MSERRVLPEILDSLPADDPEAIRSRRDLRWINLVMGNYRWIARNMRAERFSGVRWVELGAGDGGLARQMRVGEPRRISVTGIDLAPRPAPWPEEWPWLQGDLFDRLESAESEKFEGAVASLFLHHFENPDLQKIGELVSACRVLLFVEPVRRRLHHWQCHLARPLMNRVTHHDSHVSIDAGFLGHELPGLLGLSDSEWRIELGKTWLGSGRMLAIRR